MNKSTKFILLGVAIILTILLVRENKKHGNVEIPYNNKTYNYTLKYPSDLDVKEYSAENVVFGTVKGENVTGVAEVRVLTLSGNPGEEFYQAVVQELIKLCAADGPEESLSCSGAYSVKPFSNDTELSGIEIYLNAEKKDVKTGNSVGLIKGPFYVFASGSGATATRAIIVNAPFDVDREDVNTKVIEAVAKSLEF